MAEVEALVGQALPDVEVVVEPAAVAAYLAAVGDGNPAYAPAAGAAAIAPPTFAAVYALAPPGRPASGWGIAPQRLVHGEQSFEWTRPVRVGERLTTSTRVADVYSKRSLRFMVVEATSRDEAGETVCISRATILVLPDPEAEA
ncbi:MAG TPA: MaoC family dehydratase N-terminal domain-containing protein [Candidatus Dormibacteraeota bacterium]|jgi:acyl dehydratase|nr:MaoC family dehydratase N-terminal domain-containing protein [Candidatus Dormibacteraeota bacterium]